MSNKRAVDVFYDIENIIHSMSQECITAINLLKENIGKNHKSSLKNMIQLINDDINDNLVIFDEMSFSILNFNKIDNCLIKLLWYYSDTVQCYNKIFFHIIKIEEHINSLFNKDNSNNINSNIQMFFSYISNILSLSNYTFKTKPLIKTDIQTENYLELEKDKALNSIASIRDKTFYYEKYLDLFFIIKYLHEIGKLGFDINSNTANVLSVENHQ